MDVIEGLFRKSISEKEFEELKKQKKLKSTYVIKMDGPKLGMTHFDSSGNEQKVVCAHAKYSVCDLCIEITKHERMYHGRTDVIVVHD